MSKNFEYDTAAIRAQARRIKLCRDKLAQDATPRLRTVQNLLEGEFLRLSVSMPCRTKESAKTHPSLIASCIPYARSFAAYAFSASICSPVCASNQVVQYPAFSPVRQTYPSRPGGGSRAYSPSSA